MAFLYQKRTLQEGINDFSWLQQNNGPSGFEPIGACSVKNVNAKKFFFEILTRNKCSRNCPEIVQDPIHSVSEIFSYTYSSQKTNILNNYMLSMWALYAKYGFCHRINDKGLDYNALCLISSCEIWRHFLIPMGISSQQTRTNM